MSDKITIKVTRSQWEKLRIACDNYQERLTQVSDTPHATPEEQETWLELYNKNLGRARSELAINASAVVICAEVTEGSSGK